tara:strand:+ start:741 stop:3701 length:2961 start_codon:yes stop_codon:yes gene_type:complete
MSNQEKISLANIDALKGIDKETLETIEAESEIINYEMGQSMVNPGYIPENILIILSGEARLLGIIDEKVFTIGKLQVGSFVGLNSFLCVQGCESVIASSNVQAIAIKDKLILDLYTKQSSFRNWCNNTIFIAEIYTQVEKLWSKSPKISVDFISLVRSCFQTSKLITITNKQEIENDSNNYIFAGSANIKNKEIGEIISNGEIVENIGPLYSRLIIISDQIIDLINSNQNINVQEDNKNEQLLNEDNVNSQSSIKNKINNSNIELGKFRPKDNFQIINATGEIQENIACLQMLASLINIPFRKDTIEKILRDELRRGKKITIKLLGSITNIMGLHSSAAEISIEYLNRLNAPCLISWENSCALIKKISDKKIELISPSDGSKVFTSQEIKEYINQEKVEVLVVERSNITPEKKFGFKWFIPAIKKYRSILIQVFVASFVVQLFGLANPLLIQVIIDKVITQRSLDTLQVLGFALVVVTFLGGILGSLRTFLFAETTNRIDARLGSEIIDHLLRLPLNYFDTRPVGELGSRVAELEKIRSFLTGQALTTILDAAFSIIYILVMCIYSWLLTFVALAVLPIQILLTLLGTPLIRRQVRECANENAKTQSHLVEVLTGIQTVKAQNVETVSRWKWQDLYNKYISRTYERTVTGTTINEASQVLQQLSQLLVLWIGASLVLKGQLTLGQLIAFRIISGYVTQPLLRLSSIWQSFQELKVSFERLADVVDTPEESNESDKTNIPLPIIEGNVEFRDLCFSFKKNQEYVLNKINLKIDSGKFIGIVGKSGSGKSTLMKLLPRLYSPREGKILIDGFDINKVELYSLRRQIGIVPQDPLLFAGTVSDNIALTNPQASSDEIINAAKIADAHNFIMDLPLGYSTNVGERGASLSGGQRQRIAIARTLLNKPRLLIMDEATSALDYITERRVCERLKESCGGSTVFFITHRLSTIKNADEIIMLHEGKLAEKGNHESLIDQKGRYYALYRQQEAS